MIFLKKLLQTGSNMLYANWRDECTDNNLEVAIFETLGEYNKVLEMIGLFTVV